MKRRALIIILSLCAGLIGTGILIQFVRSAEQRSLAGEEVVDILVLDMDVPSGTPATSLRDFVRVEQVPVKVRAEGNIGTLERLDALGGLTTAVDLVEGEQLLESRLVEEGLARAGSDVVPVPDGLIEVNLLLESERAFGAMLEPGDTVGVVATFAGSFASDVDSDTGVAVENSSQLERPDATRLMLDKVLVTRLQYEVPPAAQPAASGDPVDGAVTSVTSTAALANTGRVSVTLAVEPFDVQRIVFAAEYASIRLVNQPESSAENGPEIMTRADVFAIRPRSQQ